MHHQFRIRFIPLVGLFAVVHVLATQYYLYWYFLWFDLVMHVWGGVLLILALGTYAEALPSQIRSVWRAKVIIAYVLTVILLWEFFGVLLNQGFKSDWVSDTIGDVVFGILGALIGYWWSKRYMHQI